MKQIDMVCSNGIISQIVEEITGTKDEQPMTAALGLHDWLPRHARDDEVERRRWRVKALRMKPSRPQRLFFK
jgi:hypothetical protein